MTEGIRPTGPHQDLHQRFDAGGRTDGLTDGKITRTELYQALQQDPGMLLRLSPDDRRVVSRCINAPEMPITDDTSGVDATQSQEAPGPVRQFSFPTLDTLDISGQA